MLFPLVLLASPDVLVVSCLCQAFCLCVLTAVVSSLESLLWLKSQLLLPTLLLLRSLLLHMFQTFLVVPAVVGALTVVFHAVALLLLY